MTTTIDSRPATRTPLPAALAPDAFNPNPHPAEPYAMPDCDPLDGPTSPAASYGAMPANLTPQGTQTTGRHAPSDARGTGAAGSDAPDRAAGDQANSMGVPLPDPALDVQGSAAVVPVSPECGSLLDPALCLAADILDDLERVRIANENRLRQLTRTETDADGEERGFGLDESHPDVALLAAMLDTLKTVEHQATLNLQRKVRKHPLGAWARGQRGVGEKQVARLLAAIGDPYINSAKGEPRTVSALWAYCGLHVLLGSQAHRDALGPPAAEVQLPGGQGLSDAHWAGAAGAQHRDTDQLRFADHSLYVGVAAKRKKGERANWSTKAKMRAYLIAESCIKQLDSQCRDGHHLLDNQKDNAVSACGCSPYRVTYDARRAHTAATHPDWTDGHSNNDALRVASKAILRDLWRAARDWHLQEAL